MVDNLRWLMWRLRSLVRRGRHEQELDEELRFHLETEAEERMAEGLAPEAARSTAVRSLGNTTLVRESTRMIWSWHWAEQLLLDVQYGWRQLIKTRIASAAAIISLALAIGACMAAFRLIDALLLRPLPVAGAERLHAILRHAVNADGTPNIYDNCSYPMFRLMRTAVEGEAKLIAVSYPERADVTYASDHEMEKAYRQYVSGWMFETFGLKAASGRLLTEADDRTPGAHPQAVISYEYWTRRFGQDTQTVGRTVRIGRILYEIVGVVEQKFTGTEPGTMVDVFVPAMMNPVVMDRDSSWFRTFVKLEPHAAPEPVRQKLQAITYAFEEERAKGSTPTANEHMRAWYKRERITLEPASSGVSGMQMAYKEALATLAVLVGLVLLIACANVANLMTARAIARAREMALRVSIGAGRFRLVQLVLIESAWIAFLSAGLGSLFASIAAPCVVSLINPPHNPARLQLPMDWRVLGFSVCLALAVTMLFGLAPALRASGVRPASALKGGEDPHARRRLMHALVAAQVGFCVLVVFLAGLFVSTYDRLAHQPTGFSSERVLVLETVASAPQVPAHWEDVAAQLRQAPGVEMVAMADRPLLNGYSWNNFPLVAGAPSSNTLAYFWTVAPGFLDTMKIPLLSGRDFRPGEMQPLAAIVNETFAKTYFGGQNPVGRWFRRGADDAPTQIVGLMRDSRYMGMRRPILPVAYFPLYSLDEDSRTARPRTNVAFLVRTVGSDPTALAGLLRKRVAEARPEIRVSNIRTQQEIVQMHTVRERLMAMLAVFFAGVALVLAGVGLFGVLDYAVLQRRREIGIRLALGAKGGHVVRRVTAEVLRMVLVGAVAGISLGVLSERYVGTLLYGVKTTDWPTLATPTLALLVAASLACLPPVLRAVRINPAQTLRNE